MSTIDTVGAALRGGVCTLAAHSESPRLDAELLLCTILRLSRAALVVRAEETLSSERREAYQGLLRRRARGAPVAYLTGTREFWSMELTVTPDVLVPRPETELLVELALTVLAEQEPCSVLELGTGSGAVALAIAAERPRARVTATDISAPALEVAMRNARLVGASGVRWRHGSWFEAVPSERFRLIVANPPYIAAGDSALGRLTAEPTIALLAGRTGLECLEEIIAGSPAHLQPGGRLLLEHGAGQGGKVRDILTRAGFEHLRTHADCFGKPRATLGIVQSSP